MRQSSLQAFDKVTRSGSRLTQKEKVYLLIKNLGPCTDSEISKAGLIKRHVVPARRGELYKEGRIMEVGSKHNTEGFLEVLWQVKGEGREGEC